MRSYNITFILITIFMLGLSLNTRAQKNNVKPSIDGPDGFRVGSFSGNLSYTRSDIFIESIGPDLDFEFSYKSHKRNRNRGFGYGWTFSFDKFYTQDANFLTIEGTDGGTKTYNFGGENWNAQSGVFDVLEEYAPGQFRSTSKDGTQCYFEDPSHKRVTKIMDRCQSTMMLTYTDSLVTQITDHTGRSLELEWTNGQLTKLTNNLLAEPRVFMYAYNGEGDLVEVTNPLGFKVKYTYDDAHRLIKVVNENNIPTYIIYHKTGGTKQIASCDMVMTFSYNPIQFETYVVQQVGDDRSITTYGFDEDGRIKEKQGNCCGYNESYVYDADNNVIYVENGNGEGTTANYDSRGNIISETDPLGNTETAEYEPNFNKVTTNVDALGNSTTYGYDTKGNLLQVDYPLGVSESFTYDAVGNTITSTNGNNHTTTYEYDTYGYLSKIINPDSTEIEYVNDAVGNTLSVTDENEHTTTFAYDAMDQLIIQTNALGYLSHTVYDGVGNVIEEINELGYATTYEFDGLNQLISKTTPAGITTHFEFDASGNIIKSIDGRGNVYTYEYNSRNQLTSQKDPLGFEIMMEYDAAGRKTMETDRLGNMMTYEYNEGGQLMSQTDPEGNTYTYTYDALGRRSSVTNPRGFISSVTYDALDRVIVETDALGNTIEKTYDDNDNLIEKKDQRGNITKYFYDAMDRKIRIEFPEGLVAKFTYDDAGNELTSSPSAGVINSSTYDALNRRTHEENAGGDIREMVYDSIGRIIEERLPNGNIILNTYDADNRLTGQSDNEGHIITYQYNANNDIIYELDADSLTYTYTFDALNRLIEEKDQSGRKRTTEYNANGLPLKQIDKDGGISTIEYSTLGLALKITNANGDITTFQYDEMANLTALTDAKGNTTTFEFDALNRQTKTNYPDGTSMQLNIDPAGNIISRVDAQNRTTNYTYDAFNRLRVKDYPDATTCTFDYDMRNRLINADNAHAQISFAYDDNNRLMSETVGTEVISYTYNESTRIKTITYPSGRVIEEQMDFRRRVTNVKEGSNQIASKTFSNEQIGTLTFGNGLTSQYAYNANRALERHTVNPGAVFDFSFSYNNKDQKTAKGNLTFPDFSEVYGYDSNNRLLAHKRGAIVNDDIPSPADIFGFTYDGVGNRLTASKNGTSTSYVANNTNAYTSTTTNSNTTNLSYTLDGQLTSDGVQTYDYDIDGRLTNVDANIEYKYDALGRRYQKIVSGVTTTYYYYDDQLIQENTSTGATREHIYLDLLDFRVATIYSGGTYYYHLDILNSVIGLSNAAGSVFERYEYDSYGNVQLYDGSYTPISNSTVDNHFYFTGKELDNESGLYYMRARHYHPGLGRFIQRDPLGFFDGPNIYQYVASNPINNYDPDGMKSCVSIGGKKDSKNQKKNDRVIIRGRGSSLRGAAILSSLEVSASGKICEACCKKTKTQGTTIDFKATVTGSFSAEVNGLTFFPLSRAITVAARLADFEIFAGVKLSLSASGSINKKKDACGKWSGGGCVTATVKTSGELYVKSTNSKGRNARGSRDRRVNASIGASVSGTFTAKVCLNCKDTGCSTECEVSSTFEAKAWIHVSITVWGIKTRISEEASYTETAKSKTCLIPIG